jgi:hypothetical protein
MTAVPSVEQMTLSNTTMQLDVIAAGYGEEIEHTEFRGLHT